MSWERKSLSAIDVMLDFAKLQIMRKTDSDDMNIFTCGNDDLDDFVKLDAQHYAKERLAVTYILKFDSDIVGYFSLANDRLSHDDFSDSTAFNRFRRRRFVNSKRIKGYAAVKLCRLAVSDSYKNKKIGTFILDFVKGMFFHERRSACRFLTVDANTYALDFYIKNGFNLLNASNATSSYTTPLYFDLADFERMR